MSETGHISNRLQLVRLRAVRFYLVISGSYRSMVVLPFHARQSAPLYLFARISFTVLLVQRRIARRKFALSLKPTFQATSSTLI